VSNPQLVFVTSLFTSRIFWAQVIALAALIATAAGFHPDWWGADHQAELVGLIDAVMTTVFRVSGPNGPVSVSAPLATPPPPRELTPGDHVVTVTSTPMLSAHPIVTVSPLAPNPA
jgi:hypothetical protein